MFLPLMVIRIILVIMMTHTIQIKDRVCVTLEISLQMQFTLQLLIEKLKLSMLMQRANHQLQKQYKLPNSSVPVFMGTDLYLAPNHKEIEGRGYIPDVMTQFDTLYSVIKLIKHYNLLKIITFFTQLLLHFISDLISSVILSGKSFKDFHDMNYQSNNTYHTNN